MAEWRIVPDSNVEVSNDGRVRRDGVEFIPCVTNNYRLFGIHKKFYYLHRLIAIAFIPNPEAKPCVDHIDGNSLNNCLNNLRWATRVENMRNRTTHMIRLSGMPRGVRQHRKRFQARIGIEGKYHHLGTFDTSEEASAVYEAAACEMFGEFYKAPL